MNTQSKLDPARIIRLIGIEIQLTPRTLGIFAIAVTAFMLAVARIHSLEPSNENDIPFHHLWFSLLLLIGGFLFTSISFSNLIAPASRQFYLSLPASTEEKFLSKWTVAAILFPLTIWIGYWLISLVVDGLIFNRYGTPVSGFGLFGEDTLHSLRLYLVLQGVFFAGSIAYVKLAAIKTIAAAAIWVASLVGVSYLAFLLLFGTNIFDPNGSIHLREGFENQMESIFLPVVEALFWYVLPLLCWTVAYFKLREKEL